MSGEGKAISPILSEADMATITPSSTNPDITDPKFQAQYRPKGKAVYFRTVTTDAYQGPNMANYLFHAQKIKSVYILDDGGAFGVGIADSFQKRAGELGMKILGRDRLDPKEADYKTILTKIKGVNPDALYYGGVMQAAAKLATQAYEVMPKVIKAGSDGVYDLLLAEAVRQGGGRGLVLLAGLAGAGDLAEARGVGDRSSRPTMKREPTNYAITAYNAVLVIADAIKRTGCRRQAARPAPNLRDAIQATKLDSIQGPIAFDGNGDILTRTVSIYQWRDGEIKYVERGAREVGRDPAPRAGAPAPARDVSLTARLSIRA